MIAVGLIVENRPGYTLGSVMNDIDFKTLQQIMDATSKKESKKTQTTQSGVKVTPGIMGVDPGDAPVMSLFDLAKQ